MRWILSRGVVGSALTVLGALIYVHVPEASWVHHVRPLTQLRHSHHHIALSLLFSFAGLALLTWAWWDLRIFARQPQTGLRSVRTAIAVWSVPILAGPPLFSGDAWSYVATGYLTGHGQSPYVASVSGLPPIWQSAVNRRWLHTPSPYGPLPHAWGGLASHVLTSPWLLMLAYRVFAIVGLALLVWATPRLAERCGQNPATASWLVLASPFMLANAVGGMHVDIVVVGLGAAALALSSRDRWVAGAVLVGLAAAVKVPGGLVALGVILLSLGPGATLLDRARRTLQVGAVAAGTLVGVGLVSGLGLGWVSALTSQGHMSGRLSLSHDVGWLLAKLLQVTHLDVLLGGLNVIKTVETLGGLLVVVAAVVILVRLRVGDDARLIRAVSLLLLAATVVLPVVHFWYFLWCLPLLACVPLTRRWRATLGGLVTGLGLASIADAAIHLSWLTPVALVLMTVGSVAGYVAAGERQKVPELAA